MKIYHMKNVFLLLALGVGLISTSLRAAEDGQGTNVVRNLRVTPAGTLSLGGTAITNWTLLPVGTGAVSLADFLAWSNTVQSATNALNTNKLGLAGGVMTGPLTNEAGFYGNGAGVTNLNATNLTGTANASNLGAGTANAGVFLRGDQVWTNEIIGNAATIAFAVNTNQLVVTNGNVGIGTNAPSARLEVKSSGGSIIKAVQTVGSVFFSVDNNGVVKFNEAGGYADAAGAGNLGARFNIGSYGSSAYALLALGPSVGFTNHYFEVNSIGDKSGDIFLVSSNKYVGINQLVPAALLDIKTTNGTFERAIKIGPNTDTLGDGAYIQFITTANPGVNIGAEIGGINTGAGGSNALVFLTGITAAEQMRINNAGDVGIGTNGPAERLHVVGNIKASGTNTAGAVVMAPGTTYNVTGANELIPFSASYIAVTGASELTASISTNSAVAGQVLVLQGGAGNAVTLTNGGNVALSSGVDFTLAENNTMQLIWNGTKWVELDRVAQ